MFAPVGECPEVTPFLDIRSGYVMKPPVDFSWLLRGVSSSQRIVGSEDSPHMMFPLPQLGRPGAKCAALIPVRKNKEWWELSAKGKRAIINDRGTRLPFLPTIARKLHYCRDFGEPFDFLSWYEYTPEESGAFERFVDASRRTEEWKYVEREVDMRLVKVED